MHYAVYFLFLYSELIISIIIQIILKSHHLSIACRMDLTSSLLCTHALSILRHSLTIFKERHIIQLKAFQMNFNYKRALITILKDTNYCYSGLIVITEISILLVSYIPKFLSFNSCLAVGHIYMSPIYPVVLKSM